MLVTSPRSLSPMKVAVPELNIGLVSAAVSRRAQFELTAHRLAVENAQLLSEQLREEHTRLFQQNALLRLGLQAATPVAMSAPPGLCCPPKNDPIGFSSAETFTSTACPSEASSDGETELTTMMMRNLPKTYDRAKLLAIVEHEGYAGTYDFVYLPIDHVTEASLGYAFVNFTSHAAAERFRDHFQGFRRWGVQSEKVCEVVWSERHQGLEAHVNRYRNSPVMHPSVRDEFKPVVFVNGRSVPFPAPTRRIKLTGVRRRDRH